MAMIIMTAKVETVVPAIILALVEDKKLIVNWSNDYYSIIYTKNYKQSNIYCTFVVFGSNNIFAIVQSTV